MLDFSKMLAEGIVLAKIAGFDQLDRRKRPSSTSGFSTCAGHDGSRASARSSGRPNIGSVWISVSRRSGWASSQHPRCAESHRRLCCRGEPPRRGTRSLGDQAGIAAVDQMA